MGGIRDTLIAAGILAWVSGSNGHIMHIGNSSNIYFLVDKSVCGGTTALIWQQSGLRNRFPRHKDP